MIDHSNRFHAALVKVQDIAKNGTRNTAAWNEVLETVESTLEEARKLDREVLGKWPRSSA